MRIATRSKSSQRRRIAGIHAPARANAFLNRRGFGKFAVHFSAQRFGHFGRTAAERLALEFFREQAQIRRIRHDRPLRAMRRIEIEGLLVHADTKTLGGRNQMLARAAVEAIKVIIERENR